MSFQYLPNFDPPVAVSEILKFFIHAAYKHFTVNKVRSLFTCIGSTKNLLCAEPHAGGSRGRKPPTCLCRAQGVDKEGNTDPTPDTLAW